MITDCKKKRERKTEGILKKKGSDLTGFSELQAGSDFEKAHRFERVF